MAKSNKTYTIQARLDLLVTVEVAAESLEEALTKARELKDTDFVEFMETV